MTSSYIEEQLDPDAIGFVRYFTPLQPDQLKGVLWVDYTRMTLVSKTNTERLTIDLNLSYHDDSKRMCYPMLVIAEVKFESVSTSVFMEIMKKYRIKKCSISKYCFGIISLHQTIKHNRFKQKIAKIHKLISQYNDPPRINNSRPIPVVW